MTQVLACGAAIDFSSSENAPEVLFSSASRATRVSDRTV